MARVDHPLRRSAAFRHFLSSKEFPAAFQKASFPRSFEWYRSVRRETQSCRSNLGNPVCNDRTINAKVSNGNHGPWTENEESMQNRDTMLTFLTRYPIYRENAYRKRFVIRRHRKRIDTARQVNRCSVLHPRMPEITASTRRRCVVAW